MRVHGILALIAALSLSSAEVFAGEKDDENRERHVVRVVTSGSGEHTEDADRFLFVGEGGAAMHIAAPHHLRGGFLGIQLVDLTPQLRAHFGAAEDSGVMVSAVSSDGPAATAGVLVGDIISAVDGEQVGSAGELAAVVRRGEEGDVVSLELWRNGKMIILEATLAERERPQIDVGPFIWKTGDEEGLKAIQMHMDSLPEEIIRIDEERIEAALEMVEKKLQSQEFKDRMRAMVEERQGMEERMKELELRLKELEKHLSQLAN